MSAFVIASAAIGVGEMHATVHDSSGLQPVIRSLPASPGKGTHRLDVIRYT